MSYFVKRKLKDGRQIRSRYSYYADKVLISLSDFEGLLDDSDAAYEQAKQLQTIIENLEGIKAEAVRKALDKIRTEILEYYTECERMQMFNFTPNIIKQKIADIFDKYKAESEG